MGFIKKNLKFIVQILFLVALLGVTFFQLLKGEELSDIWTTIKLANPGYLLLGVAMVLIFVGCEAVIIYYMMYALKKKIPFSSCTKYSFIGFFFSCITPFASGGPPAQAYYMSKDHIDVPIASLVLMIVTVMYKFVLVLIGAFLLLFYRPFVNQFMPDTKFWLDLGLVLNSGCVAVIFMLIFSPKLTGRFMYFGLNLLEKLHLLKQKEKRLRRLSTAMDKYKESAYFFRKNKGVVFHVLLISVFQRVCLFYTTYIVYRAFGFHQYSAFEIVTLQAVISIAVDMLPLPGGVGAAEALFLSMFTPIFGSGLVLSGMLLSRGISYYTLLLIGALVTIYAHISITRAALKKRNTERRRT